MNIKKLMVAVAAMSAFSVFAEGEAEATELVENKAPILWGFGNYGFYSGYQLYGSIVNTEPTLQGYLEVNGNLPWSVGPLDNLGYLGVACWCNSDLTGKREHSYRRAFNEFDPNVHWGKTFWFDDDKTWGLDYRMSFVWYWYPHTRKDVNGGYTATTMDWNHSFAILNPYLIPFLDVVHEYHESNGNLLQFGVKKPFQITDEFSLVPSVTFVWRNRNYGWCFSNYGLSDEYEKLPANLATMKLELDATYMFNKYIGVFAKVAYCQNLDDNLRDSCSNVCGNPAMNPYGDTYGRYNEFCWGGVGICVNF